MKKLQKYSLLFVVISFNSTYGMVLNKKHVTTLKTGCTRNFWLKKKVNNYGLVTATMPQTSKSALGNFRLDKTYGVRDYLAQYIAFDKKISLQDAVWEDFDAIRKAYYQFLSHNASDVIQAALNNNVIDPHYAVQALYFTHKVVTQLQDHIEHNQDFGHEYTSDPKKHIWIIKCEQKAIVNLVNFLQQRPVNPVNRNYKINPSGRVFKEKEHQVVVHLPIQKSIRPHRIAHVHDGVLGTFDPQINYPIQEYLEKYLKEQDDKIEWRALKKAYDDFLFYNMPSTIQDSFENSKNAQYIVCSVRPIIKNVTQKEVGEALLFTLDVARAMRRYLQLDHHITLTLTDEDVQLFAQLGIEPATIAQTWDGVLGNFALTKKQNGKTKCTIQDYLCKYIARNLQIPEDAVISEATFLDIKKAFEVFVSHNHPDAILRDFENEAINKQHAKEALEFTLWVISAFEEYLSEFKDDSYEMELFELFWLISRIKDTSYNMRFVEKGEWSSLVRE